jgi:hypothetical protein
MLGTPELEAFGDSWIYKEKLQFLLCRGFSSIKRDPHTGITAPVQKMVEGHFCLLRWGVGCTGWEMACRGDES